MMLWVTQTKPSQLPSSFILVVKLNHMEVYTIFYLLFKKQFCIQKDWSILLFKFLGFFFKEMLKHLYHYDALISCVYTFRFSLIPHPNLCTYYSFSYHFILIHLRLIIMYYKIKMNLLIYFSSYLPSSPKNPQDEGILQYNTIVI